MHERVDYHVEITNSKLKLLYVVTTFIGPQNIIFETETEMEQKKKFMLAQPSDIYILSHEFSKLSLICKLPSY